jgi:hypothetical protein
MNNELLQKIRALKLMVEANSITPKIVGNILEDIVTDQDALAESVTHILQGDKHDSDLTFSVDRGEWSAVADYFYNERNPNTGIMEVSVVWYYGCKYRCNKSGTHTAPYWNNPDWIMIEGNAEFQVQFEEMESIYNPDDFNTSLTVLAHLYNFNVTADILKDDFVWSRYSEDSAGIERKASDEAWNLRHKGVGSSISLTLDDLDCVGSDFPSVIRFSVEVTLRDSSTVKTQSISIEI